MTTRSLMGAMLLTVALVGCSGDDIADPTTTTVATQASVASSSTAESTTLPSSTTAVATTMLPTAPPTTVLNTVVPTAPPTAPPTTFDPDAALAEAVARDWKESMRLLYEALMDPTDPARTAAALAYTAEPFTPVTDQFIAGFRDAGQRILPDTTVEPRLMIESGPSPVINTSDVVEITVCEINPWVVVETGTGPNATDTIIDDEVYAYRYDVQLRLVDGVWRTIQNSVGPSWEGVTECGVA